MLQRPECAYMLDKLRTDLPKHLKYHTLGHTLDVYNRAMDIAIQEGVTGRNLDLLLVAAVYHDAGYLYQRLEHENRSCAIACEILPAYGYMQNDIDAICRIIMATQLPQNPKSLAEQIICDADLDYLGRDDFFTTGEGLYHEMLHDGVIANETEWNVIQVKFLESHRYFTPTSIARRNAKKQENLNQLKAKL
ncbi:HD domain-containing protein [uncultured Flavobacterium sp.]|uniref:HD domain-containing protein n=1 Tax=uncultured Flavobacterium sp. TaxID=165435 RepID=UPI0025D4CC45|nr:HD domain-containing protein [uncultured Flavobacterium sp.]